MNIIDEILPSIFGFPRDRIDFDLILNVFSDDNLNVSEGSFEDRILLIFHPSDIRTFLDLGDNLGGRIEKLKDQKFFSDLIDEIIIHRIRIQRGKKWTVLHPSMGHMYHPIGPRAIIEELFALKRLNV
jgi:hypothetical protein